jgi:hypothetical protein
MDLYDRARQRFQLNRLVVEAFVARSRGAALSTIRDNVKRGLFMHPLRTDWNSPGRFDTLASDVFGTDALDFDRFYAALVTCRQKDTQIKKANWKPSDCTLMNWWKSNNYYQPDWIHSASTGREVVDGVPTTALIAFNYVHKYRYFCAHDDIFRVILQMWSIGALKNMRDALALLLTTTDLHMAAETTLVHCDILLDAAYMVAYAAGDPTHLAKNSRYLVVLGARRVIGEAVLKLHRRRQYAARVIQKRVVEHLYSPTSRFVRQKAASFHEAAAALSQP